MHYSEDPKFYAMHYVAYTQSKFYRRATPLILSFRHLACLPMGVTRATIQYAALSVLWSKFNANVVIGQNVANMSQ